MAECVLLEKEVKPAPIMLSRDVARPWAIGTGRAEVVDGDLQPVGDIDIVGLAVVTIGNSERQAEDFGWVYRRIVKATEGAMMVSEKLLSDMVEAAGVTFGPSPEALAS